MKAKQYLLFAMVLLVLISCFKKKPPATVTSGVEVSPATSTVYRGNTQQFSAVISGNNSTQTAIMSLIDALGSDNKKEATSAIMSLISNVSTGIASTKTTSDSTKANGEISLEMLSQLTSLIKDPDTASIIQGLTQQLGVGALSSDSLPQPFTWMVAGNTSRNTHIDAEGLLTVASDETATTITVTATSTADTTISGIATVTVATEETIL